MFRLSRMFQPVRSDDASASFDSPDFTPSYADVVVLKAMLQRAGRLPLELVDSIVDLAEYWPHSAIEVDYGTLLVTTNNKFLIRSPPLGLEKIPYTQQQDSYKHTPLTPRPLVREYTPDQVQGWLASTANRSVLPVEHPCRKLVFTFQSEDQGWGGSADRDTSDPYSGSYSWFDVGLERFDAAAASAEGQESKAAGKAPEGSAAAPSPRLPPLDSLRSIIPRVEAVDPPPDAGPALPPGTTLVGDLRPQHFHGTTHHSMGHPAHRGLTRHPLPRTMPGPLPGQAGEGATTTATTPATATGPSARPAAAQALPAHGRITLPVEGLPGRPSHPLPTNPIWHPGPPGGPGGGDDPTSPPAGGVPTTPAGPTYKLHHDLLPSDDALQFNRTARRGLFTHRVEMYWTDKGGPQEDHTGRGRNTTNGEFVRSLRAGDVVTVWAKSRFAGWSNKVKRARVEVYWAV